MPVSLMYVLTVMFAVRGFVDIDNFIVVYLICFLIPESAIYMKFEQGFEKSADYDTKHFPKKLRLHPKVLAYSQWASQKRRNIFNLMLAFYDGFFNRWLGNAVIMPTHEHGTRAMSRLLFGGHTIAEGILSAAQSLENATQNVPGLNKAAEKISNLCEWMFTYPDKPLPPPKN